MKSISTQKLILYLIFIVFGLVFFTIVIANHYFFRTYTWDYGNYNFALWDYSHFHLSKCPTLYGADINFLQDHFSFTLMYFVPIYWLLNWLTGTYTLLIIQTSLILFSGWAVYHLVKNKTNDAWLGLAALLQYFTLQGRFSSFTGDVNIGILSACMVPLFLYAFESKKFFTSTLILILALFSRENMPLWFIFIFFILLIWHRKEHKTVYLILIYILISLIYFVLLFKLFIPLLEKPDRHYNLFTFSALGENPADAFLFIIKHLIESFKMLFYNHLPDANYDGIKAEFYWVYLISGGFIIFFRPQYFLWFIPILAFKMYNDIPVRWSIETYYSIEIVTILPITIFIILSKFKTKKIKYSLALLICILTIFITFFKFNPKNRKLDCDYRKEFVFTKNLFHTFNPNLNAKKIHAYLKLISENAKVSASNTFLPHLAQRQFIYLFPQVDDAEYIVALISKDFYLLTDEQYSNEINKYIFNPDWNILVKEPPFIILKKEPNKFQNAKKFICDAETISQGNKYFIASNNFLLEFLHNQSNEKVHSGKYSLKLTKDNMYGMNFKLNNVKKGDNFRISVWRFATDSSGVIVATAKSSNEFYISGNNIIKSEKNGWQLIELKFSIPKFLTDNFLGIYLWNNSNKDIYFDDLEVIRN